METVRINGQDYTSSLSDAEIAFMGNFSLPTTAQTLSGAIAEHENDISELNSNLSSLFKIKDYSATYSITGNGAVAISGTDLGVSSPTGYKPLTFCNLTTGAAKVVARNISPRQSGSSSVLSLLNTGSSAETNATVWISIIYIREDCIST